MNGRGFSFQASNMADDLVNTNGSTEDDPAADFLAREQDELAELGEDFQTDETPAVSGHFLVGIWVLD